MAKVDEHDLIEHVVRRLPGVCAVYLFGSTATPDAGANSDVDIGLLAAEPLGALERFELAEELAAAVKRDVDIVDLRSASAVLRMQVIGKGRRLYGSGVEVEAFEDRVFADYARLNEERRGILNDIRKRGSVYG